MPTYSIHGPDGKTYSIDGPEGATREQVIAKIKEKQSAPPDVSTLGDVARSFGRGIAKGAIGLVGLPGDAAKLLNEGINKGEEAFGMTPPPSADVATSGQITKGVESVAGKFGEPQTTAGKYAQSVGEFVPSSFIGPGGIATKAATTIAGGLGAEAGGEIAGEPGRFVGGLLGGGAAGVASAEGQAAKLSARLPGSEANRNAAKAAYKAIEDARLQTTPAAITTLTTGLKADLENKLIDESEARAVFRAVDNLTKGGGSIASIMGLYETLGEIPPSAGTKYTAAAIVRDGIGDFIDKLQPPDIVAGDSKFTAAMWDHAKATWSTHKKLEMLEGQADKAERQAGKTGTGANSENALRQRLDEILNSHKKSRGLSPEVKAKIRQAVIGDWKQNTARYVGKYAPSGPVSAVGTVFTGMEAGVPYGAAFGLTTWLSKHLGTYLTQRQIDQIGDMIKASSPIGKPIAAANAAQAPNRAAILPAAALRSELATSASSPLAAGQQ